MTASKHFAVLSGWGFLATSSQDAEPDDAARPASSRDQDDRTLKFLATRTYAGLRLPRHGRWSFGRLPSKVGCFDGTLWARSERVIAGTG